MQPKSKSTSQYHHSQVVIPTYQISFQTYGCKKDHDQPIISNFSYAKNHTQPVKANDVQLDHCQEVIAIMMFTTYP